MYQYVRGIKVWNHRGKRKKERNEYYMRINLLGKQAEVVNYK